MAEGNFHFLISPDIICGKNRVRSLTLRSLKLDGLVDYVSARWNFMYVMQPVIHTFIHGPSKVVRYEVSSIKTQTVQLVRKMIKTGVRFVLHLRGLRPFQKAPRMHRKNLTSVRLAIKKIWYSSTWGARIRDRDLPTGGGVSPPQTFCQSANSSLVGKFKTVQTNY